jgi:hypothetical protein
MAKIASLAEQFLNEKTPKTVRCNGAYNPLYEVSGISSLRANDENDADNDSDIAWVS